MQTLTKPQVLPAPIADIGLKNVIPNNPTGTYRASVKGGFPAITMKAKADGGVPPDGKDLNGFYNILSQFYFYTQNGGVFTFDQSVSNAIGGYPQGAVLYWKHDNVIERVESQIANNTYNFVTTPSYIDGAKWKIVTDAPLERDLGEIITSILPLSDAGLHLLDGSVLQGGGIYDDFVTYIAGLVSTYPDLFTTEANWQSAVATYGVCGKFVYNSVKNTVRLPKITGIVEGTTDLTALGDLVEAGSPNITGMLPVPRGNQEPPASSGAFSKRSATYNARIGAGSNDSWGNYYDFNASDSNSIYGNSTTVQPQTIKVLYYVVVATSTKTEIQVDIDKIATDLNGKANKDLSNIIPTQDVKSEITSWAFPDSAFTNLTLGSSGTEYTASDTGYVSIDKRAGGAAQYVQITPSSSGAPRNLQGSYTGYTSGCECWAWLFVKKGDKFKVVYTTSGNTEWFRFIKAKGVA